MGTLGSKWKPFYEIGRDINVYEHESTDVLASREGSISVLFKTIRRIGIKKAHVDEPAWYYLIVKYENPEEKTKKLKIMLFSPFRDQGQREFAMEVQTSLEKSLPPDIRQEGSWPF